MLFLSSLWVAEVQTLASQMFFTFLLWLSLLQSYFNMAKPMVVVPPESAPNVHSLRHLEGSLESRSKEIALWYRSHDSYRFLAPHDRFIVCF